MTTAIRVDSLGKMYRISHEGRRASTFRDLLTRTALAPVRRVRQLAGLAEATTEEFWALKDVGFEVQQGEVVGIIGRNGAGKSTLLKILSRIVEPTEGHAEMRGRVASLLEVGTGFHPELTGRENIYMNGSILGMRKREIDRKFDEIVEFAEVEKFLDTPVKRYSSGMYVRLAFAVAAHLEPEILIVDEVLAVGDAEFQRKCLGRMKAVAHGSGRTVLFVSHNMPAVESLCGRCCVLEGGKLARVGPSSECVSWYLSRATECGLSGSVNFERPGSASPWMVNAALLVDGQVSARVPMGSAMELVIDFRSDTPTRLVNVGFMVNSAAGDSILNANNQFLETPVYKEPVRGGRVRCSLGAVPLVGGKYFISLWFGDRIQDSHIVERALAFELVERDIWGTGRVPPPSHSLMWWPTRFAFEDGAST